MPETDRYHRQRLFHSIGDDGQSALAKARVAVVGVGALGSHAATHLARSGVGYLRLIDRDIVEETNLQRQILFEEADAANAQPKAIAAARRLAEANSTIEIAPVATDLSWRNADSLLGDVDIVIDGTDNFATRRLINDVAVKHNIPWVYGGCVSSYGSCALLVPGVTPCFVCLFGDDTGVGLETCDTVGVLSPAIAMVAATQAAEAIKWLTGNRAACMDGVLHMDVWSNQYDVVRFPARRPDCRCCAKREFTALQPIRESTTVTMCGRDAVQVRPAALSGFSLRDLANRLQPLTSIRSTGDILQCVLDERTVTVFGDGRALIQGTTDEHEALRIYRRYIGG